MVGKSINLFFSAAHKIFSIQCKLKVTAHARKEISIVIDVRVPKYQKTEMAQAILISVFPFCLFDAFFFFSETCLQK